MITVSLLGVGILSGIVPDLRRTSVAGTASSIEAMNKTPAMSEPAVALRQSTPAAPVRTADLADSARPSIGSSVIPPALALAPGEVLIASDSLGAKPVAAAESESSAAVAPRATTRSHGPFLSRAPVPQSAPVRSTSSGGLTDGATSSGAGDGAPERVVAGERTRSEVLRATSNQTAARPSVPRLPSAYQMRQARQARQVEQIQQSPSVPASPRITPVLRAPIPLEAPSGIPYPLPPGP